MLPTRIHVTAVSQCWQQLSKQFRRSYAQVIQQGMPQSSTQENSKPGPDAYSTAQTKQDRTGTGLALRRYKPRTPGIRHLVRPVNDHLWKGRPLSKLTFPKKGQARGGRNNTGHVTVRHRGAGHKRRIRSVDFARHTPGAHDVERVEHDPGRTAHIALVRNRQTGEQSYILAAEGLRSGDVVQSYRAGIPQELIDSMGGTIDQGILATKTAFKGNCLELKYVPVGTPIFNICPDRGSIGKLCRSAGTYGVIIGKGEDAVQKEMIKAFGESGQTNMSTLTPQQLERFEQAVRYVTVKLSSGEIRLIENDAVATIGVASNANYQYTSLGKAGRKRWLGIRPTVRGLAMNAADHPHGGGRGKSKGNVHPVSPWGIPVCFLSISLTKKLTPFPPRQNQDSRHVRRTKSISSWCKNGLETKENGGAGMPSCQGFYHVIPVSG